MKLKTNVLLTGASGTVGLAILKQLTQRTDKYDVTVFDLKSRSVLNRLKPFQKKVNLVYGDISVPEEVDKVCSNKDVVIHLAAIIPPLADDNPKLAARVNVDGTKNLVESLEKNSPDSFLLYSSSISVYGDRTDAPEISVNSELRPSKGDEYAKTKIQAEDIVCSSKLSWSIFRLTAIMGYGNHKVSKLMFHMPLRTSLEIATPEDTGLAFVNALQKLPQLDKRIFNLGGGELCRTTYKEFLSRSFKIMGLGKLTFPKRVFANDNFHCGNYIDGDELEEILNFRSDTIDTYFQKLEKTISPFQYLTTHMLKKIIKGYFLRLSEFYNERR